MNDRDFLLIKAILSVIVGLAGIGVFYLTFDNTLIGLLIGLTFATWYLFRTYKSIILPYQDKGAEIIFKGFNLKGQIIYIIAWLTITYLYYKANKDFQYFFYSSGILLIAIEEGIKLIIFDFNKKKVIGLFDNEIKDTKQLTIDYIENENSSKIKVTDKSGFFTLDKNSFTDSNWTRLLTNLNKLKGDA